jgi:phenylacetic acid degradation operon negative regulatory protein
MDFEASIRDILRQRPQRAGAFIVTLYGDVVVPRGGVVWIGNLIETCAGIDISESLVRTAVSRLVAAGRLEGEREGRRSYYRLTRAARAEFSAAADVLFAGPDRRRSDRWRIICLPEGAPPEAFQRLEQSGFGRLAPRIAIAADPRHGAAAAEGVSFEARLPADTPPDRLRALAESCWQLGQYAEAYTSFLAAFRPLAETLSPGAPMPSDANCLVARLLLINEFRRIALRDPGLPAAALPDDWPGHDARRLYAQLYVRLSSAAERHVSARFIDSRGPLQVQGDAVERRLSSLQCLAEETRNVTDMEKIRIDP